MKSLPQLTPELLKVYQEEIARLHSPKTVKRKISSLRRFFDWAVKRGHIAENPLSQLSVVGHQVSDARSQMSDSLKTDNPKSEIRNLKSVSSPSFPFLKLAIFGISGILAVAIAFFFIKDQLPGNQVPGARGRVPTVTQEEIGTRNPTPDTREPKSDIRDLISGVQSLDVIKAKVLELLGENPLIKAEEGPLSIQSEGISLQTLPLSDGDITLAPDGQGQLLIRSSTTTEDSIDIRNANLTTGTLINANVGHTGTKYKFLEFTSGEKETTKFSVDAQGNVIAAGKITANESQVNELRVTKEIDLKGDLLIGGVVRLNKLGRLASITGYYQDSGLFLIDQGTDDVARITKKGITATTPVLELILDETGKTSSGYDTLVLKRKGGKPEGYALSVDEGNALFGGDVVVQGNIRTTGSNTVSGSQTVSGDQTISGDLAVNGGDITTTATTFNLINSTATNVNFAGSATTLSIGASTGTTTINNGLTVTGSTTLNGALTANGSFTLGDNGDTGSINTSDWDISTTGDMTGIGAITADGDLTISQATPSIFLTDTTTSAEDFSINVDGDQLTLRNETDSRNDLTISGSGALTLNGASVGEGTSTLTVSSGDLTLTDGDLALSSGEISATSDDAAGTAFSFTGVSTTGNVLGITANSLTTGNALSISSTSTTGGASGVSKLIDLSRSGANANSSHTAYGLYSSVTNTGTTSTNIAGYFTASGATTNYGIYSASGLNYLAGNTGIGTSSPANPFEVQSTTTPQLRIAYDTSNYVTLSTSSTGAITLDATGTGAAFTISDGLTASSTLTVSGTTTLNGAFTLGDGGDTGSINTSDWDISTAGAMTNIDSIANASADLALSTTTSGNITLTPATTTGLVNVLTGNLKVGDGTPALTQDGEDAYIEGTLEVDGLARFDGSLDFGDTTADTVTFTAVVDSNILADASNTRDLGSSSVRWATGYFTTLDATNLSGTVTGGSTTSSSWTLNSDNATNNAEISSLAFESGSATFNAAMQWNASGDAGRQTGYDNNFLYNYPISIFSQVSGAEQTFTSGSLINYGQSSTHAITQSGAFVGVDIDFSSNITNATQNQTGVLITLKDGSSSGTAIGFQTAGTMDYGLDIGGTVGTADIRLSNAETISNTTNGTIAFAFDGTNELSLTTSALFPSTDSGLDLGSSSSQFADLYLDGGNINLDNATDIDIDDNSSTALTISEGTNNYLLFNTANDITVVTLDTPVAGSTSTTGNLFTANTTKTINLGTGTSADTINIGTGGTTADAITIGNTGVATVIDINSGAATVNAIDIATDSVTTANALALTANALTSGTALALSSTATSFNGELLTLSKTGASGSTAFTSDIANITYSQTFNGGVGLTSSGNVLDISRSITLDNATNTHTISGDLLTISDSATQTAGTLTHTADVVSITQNYTSSSGTALMVTNLGGSSSTSFRVNDETGDTDSTPFLIDAAGNVGIGTTAPGIALEVVGGGRVQVASTTASGQTVNAAPTATTITMPASSASGYTGTVQHVTLPALTYANTSNTGTATLTGLTLSQGAINTGNQTGTSPMTVTALDISGANNTNRSGLYTWKGVKLTTPSLQDQTSQSPKANDVRALDVTLGTVDGTSAALQTGLYVTGGTQTTGTQRGVYVNMASATHTALWVDTGAVQLDGALTVEGTLDGNGIFTLGDNGDTGAIDTSDWDISTTGDLTGIGAIGMDGDLTITQATPSILFVDNTAPADDYSINVDANAFSIVNDTDTRTEISFDGAGSIDFGDNTATKTIDIGGVTNSAADTINIATNSTAADTISIGNTNASTTLALTGGDDWSMAATGILTMSASASQTTAIVVTDTDYTNALSIGDNNITGTTYSLIGTAASIDFSEFDVSSTTGSITINDDGDLGQISIESTVLDINSLDFTGAGTLTSGAGTNLTFTPGTTGDLIFSTDSDTVATFTGSAEGTANVTLTAGDLTISDGDLILSGGEILATSDDATGTNFSFTTGALSTGTGLGVTSTSNALTSGVGLSVSHTASSATASFSGDTGILSTNRTNSTAAQTLTDSGNVLELARTTITNNGTATTNVTGPILNITNTATQTLGTLSDSAALIKVTQDADATGALLHLVSNRSSTSYSLLIEQTDGGTDTLSLTDAGNLTINGDFTVTGGDLNGPSGENIDLGEATADTITFYIASTGELILNASAIAPSTDSGLDLGTSSSQFADLYLDGGNINLDNATDIDIDDSVASVFTISQGTSNFLAISTDTDAMSFGNATTNPTFGFLGTGAVTIAGSADGTDALILTKGDILISDGDFDLSGGDFNVTLDDQDTINLGGTAASSTAGNGAAAANLITATGPAGQATSGITGQIGGAGSALSLTGGAGGAATGASGSNIGGAGGALTLLGGTGGAATSGTGGAGGAISITAGSAGSGGNANGGTLTLNSGAVTGSGTSTLNLGTSNSTVINIGDSTVTKTIDIGGVTSSDASTINIATEGTAADTITIGNTNASTTLALTGGDDWSITTAGASTFSSGTFNGNVDMTGDLILNIGDAGTDFTAGGGLTLAELLTVNDDVDINLAAGENLNIAATAASTADMVVITNTGQASTTDGVDGLQLTFGSSNASGNVIDITPSVSVNASETFNVIDIDAFTGTISAAGTLTLNAISVGTLTQSETTGTITAIGFNIGTGWDTDINATTSLEIGIGGTNELTLTSSALSPSTDSGQDLGTSSSQFADLYLDGGNINLDNATDIDIDDNTASALTVTAGTDTYFLITTSTGAEVVTLNNIEAGTMNIGTTNVTRTLNLATGTGADTINIGTGATNADAITIGNTGVATVIDINSGAATVNAVDIVADSVTTATALALSADALTTGKGLDITSTANALDSGVLLNVSSSQTAATDTTLSADIANFSFSPTYSTAVTTPAISGNVLDLSRTTTTNSLFASTLTVSGPILNITNTATQTTGTLTDSSNLVVITQDADATGALLHLVSNRSSTNYSLLIEQTSGGTDTLSLTDAGNLTINGDFTVTGGDLNGPSGENIDLGEATADTITFYIATAAELSLNATALAPSTDSGLDLGTSSSQFADLYLDGGNINLDNATDIDIDDNNSTALTISEGTNNYLLLNTANDVTVVTLDTPVAGSTSTTGNLFTAAVTKTVNISDSASTNTIDIGGVTNSGTDTINIATEGTAADTISIGNTNASTTLALTGGDDWSMAATGILTMSASAAQTTAIVVTDTDYTNALSIGDNNITGTTANIDLTYFDVTGSTGAVTIDPQTTGTYLDFTLETAWTSGTLINADFASATTQGAATITGVSLNLNTNLTTPAAGQNITGYDLQLPTASTTSNTTTYTGFNLGTSGAITNGTAGSFAWRGVNIAMPNITQSAGGSVTSSGILLTTGSITTAGTQHGLNISASGVGAGTLNAINIGTITGSGGTETAINIAAGWDTDINATTSLEIGIGGTNEVTLTASALSPSTSDSNALGTTSLMWSDLFLASGGVINFNNGDMTITHATDALGIEGGNVGIGVTNPGTDLDIQKSESGASTNIRVFNTSDTADSAAEIQVISGGTSAADAKLRFQIGTDSSNAFTLGIDNSDNDYFKISDGAALGTNDRLVIDTSGNVGIGTASPNNRLEVLSTTTPQLRVAYDTSNYFTQAVSNVGAVTFDATGASAGFTFSDAVTTSSTLTSQGAVTIDADGTETLLVRKDADPTDGDVLTVDTTNKVVRIGESYTNASTGTTLTTYGDTTVKGKIDIESIANITDIFVYDTTKDSDGGKWTNDERVKASSWYNETIDATGAGCTIDTNDRCGRKEFPEKAIIIATTTKLYIFDAKDNTLWMDFRKGATTTEQMIGPTDNSTGSAVYALNGKVYYGNNGTTGQLYAIDFKADRAYRYNTTDDYIGIQSIANRNTTVTWLTGPSSPIVNAVINDVHARAVNGDSFVVVGTDAGMSVINETDNAVFDYDDEATAADEDYNSVWLDREGNLWALNETAQQLERWNLVVNDTTDENPGNPNSTWDETTTPALFATAQTINVAPGALYVTDGTSVADGKSQTAYVGHNGGLTVVNTKVGDETNGSVKYYSNAYVTEEMPGDIRAMYPLSESSGGNGAVLDRSVKAGKLTNVGGVTFSASAVRGAGVTLNGSTGYLCTETGTADGTCDDDANFDFGSTGDFSVSMWAKNTAGTAARHIFFAKQQTWNGATTGYSANLASGGDAGRVSFRVREGANVLSIDTNPADAITDSNWHHYTFVRKTNGTVLEIWIDGALKITTTGTARNSDNALSFRIGTDTDGSVPWGGSIDEVMVAAEALSASQIKRMYLIGNRALQNHTASRITGVTGADNYQRLMGNASGGTSTTNRVFAVTTDDSNQFIYAGLNDGTNNTGGVTVIGVDSDSAVDLYDATANTGKDDDAGTQFAGSDVVAVSVAGTPCIGYNSGTTACSNTATIGIAGTNDTTTSSWTERNDASLYSTLATLTSPDQVKNNVTVNNIFRVFNTYNNLTASATGERIETPALSVDSGGNLVYNYLGPAVGATALDFNDSVLTTGTLADFTSTTLTTGTLINLVGDAISTGKGIALSVDGLSSGIGLDISSTSTAAATNYLVNLTSSGAANSATRYGVYAALSGTGTSSVNVGGYFSVTGATTNRGLEVAAMTGATSTGLTIGALSGTTANTGVSIGAISGSGATGAGITVGNISTTGTTNYGLQLGTMTGGTTSNYQISTGVLTSATTTTNAQINLGGVVTTGGTTNYGVNVGALSGSGTTNYGINIATLTSTGTTNYGLNIAGATGAATTNYGLLIGAVSGATTNYGLYTTSGTTVLNATSGNVGIGDASPDAKLDIDSTSTSGADFLITNTGISTSGSIATITANSLTTGDVLTLNATGMTTGSLIIGTGPSSTGVTDHFVKLTSDIGSAASILNLNPDFSGSAVTGYGIYNTATDATANANTDYGYYGSLALSGNAAKTGVGLYSTVTSSSTTADTLLSLDLATDVTGIMTTGTRSVYGLRTQPSAGAESTGGTTNVYGIYSKVTADVAAGGTVNGYGLYVANGTFDTDGTSAQYGLYVEAPTGADTNVAGYFGGNVGIGTTAPDQLLHLSSTGDTAVRFTTQSITKTFSYTGAEQTWTVPAGATSLTVDARGAAGANGGGGGTPASGGSGGRTQTTLTVTPAETLYIYVGAAGSGLTGGFNGGANAGDTTNDGGGGGGAADIRQGGNALANRVVVAGGGGGAGANTSTGSAAGGSGGGGGETTAGNGGTGAGAFGGFGGAGGTQSAGGAGGAGGNSQPDGSGGTSGNGGAGGAGSAVGGGGGGGGYFGGGGGEGADSTNGGGGAGGGSSFADAGVTSSTTHTQGFQSGNGEISVTYTVQWVAGSDQSDEGKFKIAGSTTLGTRDYVTIAAGNVGIGTTAPAQELEVVGDIRLAFTATETTNGVCHSGADIDAAQANTSDRRDLVVCSAAPGDIAEWYDTTGTEAGDIVVATNQTLTYESPVVDARTGIVSKEKEFITASVLGKSYAPYQPTIIGIISTSPYQTFGKGILDKAQMPNPVALIGRVPAKVSTENGSIRPGDSLTTSSTPGVAMKATKAGPIIGKALGAFPSSTSSTGSESSIGTCSTFSTSTTSSTCQFGKVLVFVNVSWYDPDVYLTGTGDLNIVAINTAQVTNSGTEGLLSPDASGSAEATESGTLASPLYTLKRTLTDGTQEIIERIGAFSEVVTASLKAGVIEVNQLISDQLTSKTVNVTEKLISPVVETDELAVNEIRSATDSANIVFNLRQDPEATESAFGKLIVQGNLEVSQDATISGTLYADKIKAREIEGLSGTFNELAASVSATQKLAFQEAQQTNQSIVERIRERIQNLESRIVNRESTEPSIRQLLEETATSSATLAFSAATSWQEAVDQANQVNSVNQETLQASLNLTGGLNVLGNTNFYGTTTLADTVVNGAFTVVNQVSQVNSVNQLTQLTLSSDSVSVLGGTLKLAGSDGVNIMNGALLVNVNGDVEVTNKLTVRGTIQSSRFAPLAGGDIDIALANGSELSNSGFGKLLVRGTNDEVVASIDASGSATFRELSTPKLIIASPRESATESAQISAGEATSNSTAGKATLLAGTTELKINNPNVAENTLIYVTPISSTSNQVLYVRSVDSAGSPQGYFTVAIDNPISADIEFNWWIIELN